MGLLPRTEPASDEYEPNYFGGSTNVVAEGTRDGVGSGLHHRRDDGETLHTAERLWQRVEAMLEMFQSVPLPGEDHDAQGSVRTEADET